MTEKEARDTEEEYKAGNAAMSTYKASQAAWKASQTAEAANEAEQFALEASQHARNARTAAALDNALAAAQAYNQASRSPLPLYADARHCAHCGCPTTVLDPDAQVPFHVPNAHHVSDLRLQPEMQAPKCTLTTLNMDNRAGLTIR